MVLQTFLEFFDDNKPLTLGDLVRVCFAMDIDFDRAIAELAVTRRVPKDYLRWLYATTNWDKDEAIELLGLSKSDGESQEWRSATHAKGRPRRECLARHFFIGGYNE